MSDWPSLSTPGPLVLVTFLTSAPDFTERAVHTGDDGAIVHAELVRTGATGAPAAVLLGRRDARRKHERIWGKKRRKK